MADVITVREISRTLRRQRYGHANEIELHDGIARVLAAEFGLTTEREVRLSERDRIDLGVDLPRPVSPVRLGIEAKIAGSAGDVRRQLRRYAAHDQLDALLLVTTVYRHMAEIIPYVQDAGPDGVAGAGVRWLLDGKPFEVALINRGAL